jgi:hypothetical protein
MEFYYFGGNFEPGFLDEINESEFVGVMFTYDVTQGDIFTRLAHQAKSDQKIKYLIAIRPYAISPQYLCMINNSMTKILNGNRLQINFISGYLKNHEEGFGGLFEQSIEFTAPPNNIDRSNYLIKYVDILSKMEGNKNNPLDFYISTTNPTVEKAANKYNTKIILPYKVYKAQYWEDIDKWNGKGTLKKPLNLNYSKVMLAITPVIRKNILALEQLPEDYAYRPLWRDGETSNKVSDIEFFTYDQFVSFIKDAEEKGITQLLINSYPNREFKIIKHYVNKYCKSEGVI